MAIQLTRIYCDESCTHAGTYFIIGGLECTPRRAEILTEEIAKVRKRYAFPHEFKWTKIGNNKRYVCLYKDLVSTFIKDRFAKLKIVKFHKADGWKAWGTSEEERFFKSYFNFLLSSMNPYKTYDVTLDDKSLQKQYRWSSLFFSLKGHFESKDPKFLYGNKRLVKTLQSQYSQSDDLLQLTDVLINALTTDSATCEGKVLISRYVLDNLDSKRAKIKDWVFDKTRMTKQNASNNN